ncbi:MAG: M81 family metallopeptidase [Pseudomonadota bacterium]
MTRRVFLAGLFQETSDFSPIPTGSGSFEAQSFRPGENQDPALPPENLEPLLGYGGAWTQALEQGWDVVLGPLLVAVPAGRMSRTVWDGLVDEILSALRRAGPVDAVFLMLHGATLVAGLDDAQARLVAAIRKEAGDVTVIGAAFDLHGNMNAALLSRVDIPVACRTYPHVDFVQTGRDVMTLIDKACRSNAVPALSAYSVPVVGICPTGLPKMRSLLDRMQDAEADAAVLRTSLFHGFAGADHPDVGATVLLLGPRPDLDEMALVRSWAGDFADAAASGSEGLDANNAVQKALNLSTPGHPAIVADRSDNPGGGAAGDNTELLSALLDADVRDAALAMIWDPVSVSLCFDAGVGAVLDLRIGGKAGPLSGKPVDMRVEIVSVSDSVKQAWFGIGPPSLPVGRSVRVRHGTLDIILNDKRGQVFSPHVFTQHGVKPKDKAVLVVKSTAHFETAFGPLGPLVPCDVKGTLPASAGTMRALPYRRITRPLWPLDPYDPEPRLLIRRPLRELRG